MSKARTLHDEVVEMAARVRDAALRVDRQAESRRRRRIAATTAAAGVGAVAGAIAVRGARAGVVEESIEVGVPVQTAYDQWTQFEEFPSFMDAVESVTQVDDTHLRWVAEVGGDRQEWDAEISEQRPDERVAWHATTGKRNSGVVTFHRLSDSRTKVMVQMEFEPEGVVERIGSAIGADDRRVKRDLTRFKELIESRGTPSGAWRGEVDHGAVVSDAP